MSNKRKIIASCPCVDCGWPTAWRDGRPSEWYMVTDEVWTAAGMPRQPVMSWEGSGQYLCVGCIEARLGRTLTSADFTDCELNLPGRSHTPRLNSRLESDVVATL